MRPNRIFILCAIFALFTQVLFSGDMILHPTYVRWMGDGSGYYNPFDLVEYCERQYFSFKSLKENKDYYFITFSRDQHYSYDRDMINIFNGHVLNFQIKDELKQRILKERKDAEVDGDVLAFSSLGPDVEYCFLIPPGQIVPPGLYRSIITVMLYEGVLRGHNRKVEEKKIFFKAFVPKMLSLVLVDEGASFINRKDDIFLDFEKFENEEKKECDLLVRSNVNYEIKIKSKNRGSLVKDGANKPYNDPFMINYDLKINNTHVNLSDFIDDSLSFQKDFNREIDRHRITVTINEPNLGKKLAGYYRDTITFTATCLP